MSPLVGCPGPGGFLSGGALGRIHISSKHYMGPTPIYGARAEKKQKADFAMKQMNICRLSGDIIIRHIAQFGSGTKQVALSFHDVYTREPSLRLIISKFQRTLTHCIFAINVRNNTL